MKKKIAEYIENFFDELRQSRQRQTTYSKGLVDFDKDGLFEKITDGIQSKEDQRRGAVFYKKQSWLLAASCVGVLLFGYFFYLLFTGKPTTGKTIWESAMTAADRIDSLVLQDGTKVWLNVNSAIRYPQHFTGKSREVVLNGEAYFEVKHDPVRPFVIHSANITTTVLGTSFDVNAYQGNKVINVTVRSGKVAVADSVNRRKTYLITPTQQVSFHKGRKTFSLKKDVNMVTAIGWQKNKLIFEDKALKNVIPLLNRKFNAAIVLDSTLADVSITANFEDESLDNILRVLSLITNRKVVRKKSAIFLKE